MLGLTAPLWLVALAAVPLVRWLHRWRAPLRNAPVSAAFLWNSAEQTSAGGQRKDRPDPAWRRRALIVALLAISLAGPWWQQDVSRITVWVDDSLSMSTVEAGESRLQAGLSELADALGELPSVEAELRSLSDPARARSDGDPLAFNAASWLDGDAATLLLPPAATLDRDAAHWLVTDGADDRLQQWAARAPLARIIGVGSATANVALTRLAVRRSLRDPDDLDVLVAVTNTGTNEAIRSLTLEADAEEQQAFELVLAAGETRYVNARHGDIDTALSAILYPGDATAGDDSLELSAPALERLPVELDPACPEPLRQAIRAHSGLQVVERGEAAQLQVHCSRRNAVPGPSIRFHGMASAPVDAAARWQPGVGRLEELNLPAGWLAAGRWELPPADADEVVLSADGEPLIIVRAGSPVTIESTLDMSRAEFANQPEYPVLISGLVDLALGRTALDPIIASARDPAASAIAPSRLRAAMTAGPTFGAATKPLGDVFLILAALVLLLDLVLIWRASRAARHG